MPIGESEATILPASSTPAGNLEVLPREIRDEIYGYVFGTIDLNELVVSFGVLLALQIDSYGTTRLQWDEMYPSSILKLSKRIRQEAMEFLYSKGVFRIHDPSTNTKDTLFMDRIMNVRLSYFLSLEQRLKVTSLFAGTQVLRGTFTEECDVYDTEKQIMEPPMIEAVKQLISFKTVAVQILESLGRMSRKQESMHLSTSLGEHSSQHWDLAPSRASKRRGMRDQLVMISPSFSILETTFPGKRRRRRRSQRSRKRRCDTFPFRGHRTQSVVL